MKNIMIAPTYRCNANCPYCYTNSFKSAFKKDMDFLTFLEVVNRFSRGGGKNLKFIGGEPTIWKHIRKAIIYSKLRGFYVEMLSNGFKAVKTVPDRIFINISHYFDLSKRPLVINSLDYYLSKNVAIVFRYNIIPEADFSEVEELIGLARKYGAHIDIVPAVPYPKTREMGKKIYRFIKYILDQKVSGNCSNPLLPCMFTKNQWEYLKKNISLFSVCSAGNGILVNPDGKTVLPCTKLFLPKDISALGKSFEKKDDAYREDLEKIRQAVPKECENCGHFLKKECFGGCYMERMNHK